MGSGTEWNCKKKFSHNGAEVLQGVIFVMLSINLKAWTKHVKIKESA